MRSRWTTMLRVAAAIGLLGGGRAGAAQPAFSCAGFAQLGGAQLLCSHTDPAAPTQICTFSWSLAGPGGSPTVVQGSFLLTPGLTNATVSRAAVSPTPWRTPWCCARRGGRLREDDGASLAGPRGTAG